ncbi:unnamed protein product [Rhizoctonia solani]|uniref:Secreted protein n=1 Tax=Rhizoctonia solani TaxID=456999 RepID=A0A8H2X216_9AGAM|nr:unnamed protein product [Rhizoctonia solani]
MNKRQFCCWPHWVRTLLPTLLLLAADRADSSQYSPGDFLPFSSIIATDPKAIYRMTWYLTIYRWMIEIFLTLLGGDPLPLRHHSLTCPMKRTADISQPVFPAPPSVPEACLRPVTPQFRYGLELCCERGYL